MNRCHIIPAIKILNVVGNLFYRFNGNVQFLCIQLVSLSWWRWVRNDSIDPHLCLTFEMYSSIKWNIKLSCADFCHFHVKFNYRWKLPEGTSFEWHMLRSLSHEFKCQVGYTFLHYCLGKDQDVIMNNCTVCRAWDTCQNTNWLRHMASGSGSQGLKHKHKIETTLNYHRLVLLGVREIQLCKFSMLQNVQKCIIITVMCLSVYDLLLLVWLLVPWYAIRRHCLAIH